MRITTVVVPLLVSVGFAATAHAQAVDVAPVAPVAVPQIADVSGTYTSTWGVMTLRQSGTRVTGTYVYHHGTIDGTIDGSTLRFTWREDDGVGRGELVRDASGELVGSWGTGESDTNGGLWRASPDVAQGSPASLLGPPALAPVADPVPDDPSATAAAPTDGPHAGSWSLELALPVDVTFGSPTTLIGVAGLDIGLGKRLTDNWYVGGTAGFEALVSPDFLASNTPGMRIRGGAEARYIFNRGTGSASINCGPAFPVPRTDWVAARAGVETLDEGATLGAYGEVSIGTDMWLGQTQIGMYLTAGLSVDPASAYGTPAPADDPSSGLSGLSGLSNEAPTMQDTSSTATAEYIALGWRVAFG